MCTSLDCDCDICLQISSNILFLFIVHRHTIFILINDTNYQQVYNLGFVCLNLIDFIVT